MSVRAKGTGVCRDSGLTAHMSLGKGRGDYRVEQLPCLVPWGRDLRCGPCRVQVTVGVGTEKQLKSRTEKTHIKVSAGALAS